MYCFRCIAECTNCYFGQCVGPNECACLNGYENDNTTKGCIPICTSCTNGTCTAPNICKCNDGFKKATTSQGIEICEPECHDECKNARCVAPNKCECLASYEFRNGSITECLSVCPFSNSTNNITETDDCTCWPNYKVVTRTTGKQYLQLK